MAYPTGTDLANFLVSRGILASVPADLDDLNDIMIDVAAQWEQDTGWIPFLAPAGDTTRTYTLNGDLLFLQCGLISVDSLEIDGSAYTEDTDFFLVPVNEDRKTRIQFASIQSTGINAIEIDGHWGYIDDLDDVPDVIRALLRKGAADFMRDISNSAVGTGGAIAELKQDDVTKKYATGSDFTGEYSGTLQEQFGRSYRKTVSRYKAPWMVMA